MSIIHRPLYKSLRKSMVLALAAAALSAPARAQETPANYDELRRRIDVLAEEINRFKTGETQTSAGEPGRFGFAPSASKIYRTDKGLSIGGYGESLYQRKDNARDDGSASGTSGQDSWDALRAVFYTGYKFNDRFLVNTEIEFEHGNTKAGGEAGIEFAYVDAFVTPAANLRAGLLLLPMGFQNELHEPTVFLGARRTETENAILPSTWRENGVGVFGDVGPVSYRTYLVNGLQATGFTASGIRGGRQKGTEAKADAFASVTRIDWQLAPGALLGASGYLGKSGQGSGLNVGTKIAELHAELRFMGLELRALGAQAWLDDVAALNASLSTPLTGSNSIGSKMFGGYLQAGYDVFTLIGMKGSLIPFVRWEKLNTQAEVPTGYSSSPSNNRTVFTLGANYLPIDSVVVKLDWQNLGNEAGTAIDQLNFAVGYAF